MGLIIFHHKIANCVIDCQILVSKGGKIIKTPYFLSNASLCPFA